MPKAIVELDEKAYRIVNIVKAKYGLKDKGEAINRIAEEYGEELLEPKLRPEWVEKMKKRAKEKAIRIDDFEAYYLRKKKR